MAEESCRVCNGDELGFFFIAHLPECGNGKGGETGVAVCSSVKAAQLVVLIMAKHYFLNQAMEGILYDTLEYLKKSDKQIDSMTQKTYEYYASTKES